MVEARGECAVTRAIATDEADGESLTSVFYRFQLPSSRRLRRTLARRPTMPEAADSAVQSRLTRL